MVYAKQLLENIAASYEQFDLNKALEFRIQISDGVREKYGDDSVDYAESLFKLFTIYKQLKRTQEALQNLELAYKIQQKAGNNDHKDISIIVFNLAYLNYFQQNYSEALQYF